MLRLFLSLPILLASCQKDETISGYVAHEAEFYLTEISGVRFVAKASIRFPEQGSVTGKAPCNSYAAPQSAPLPWFELGPIRSTRSACPDLALETEFFDHLSRMTLAETLGHVVILRNDAGEEMVFEADQD